MTNAFESWPLPLAHEYRRLHDELVVGAVVPAILQLKDFVEVLVKLAAVTAGRLLIDAGSPSQRGLARDLLLARRPATIGTWLEAGGELCAEALRRDMPALRTAVEPFVPMLAPIRDPLTREASALAEVLRRLVAWRNREIGHGALRLDLTGYLPELRDHLDRLNDGLASHARGLSEMTIRAPGSDEALVGADALVRHSDALREIAASRRHIPLQLGRGNVRLSLGPYVYLHLTLDTEVGCFVIDKRIGRDRAIRLQLLDYRTGSHIVVRRADREPLLLSELDALADDEVETRWPDTLEGHAFDRDVQQLLDSISVQREYVSPIHFRNALRDFTGPPDAPARDRGLMWLSAPADVGKSMFALSLATLGDAAEMRRSLGAPVLWEDMACLVFAARREYRSTAASLEAHAMLELGIKNNDLSLALSHYLHTSDGLTPGAAFGRWLGALRAQAAGRRRRLLLVLDGLDELPTGAHRSRHHDLLSLLPSADELPSASSCC